MIKGSRPNQRGKALETFISNLLDESYQRVSAEEFFAHKSINQQPIYASQVVTGKNIYGKDRRVDFIVFHPRKWPKCLVIQCKWQSSSGSVEEKFPFEVECIRHGEHQTIIVLDGGGYSAGAKNWLLGQRGGKLEDVCDQGEFARLQSSERI